MENEKQLIDAEKVIEDLTAMKAQLGVNAILIDAMIDGLKRQPQVDAVEVVRCRDCVHYDVGVCLKIYSDGAVNQCAWQARNEDDFCSYGERKDVLGNGKA